MGPAANSRCGPAACFYTHALAAVCREMGVRFSITIRQHKGLRELIEAIPEQDWTPTPYQTAPPMCAETTYTPFQPTPRRCGSSSGGWHARFPARPYLPPQLSRLHHRLGWG